MSQVPKQLNLGCGRSKRPECLNVDVRSEVAPDLEWDLDQRPYLLRHPRSSADVHPIRRTLGAALDGSRALCGQQRLLSRSGPHRRMALPRLGD